MSQPILLIVDDEKSTRDGLRMAMEDQFDCYVASDAKQAQQILKNEAVDILLTDLRLGGDSGMDILEFSRGLKNPPTAVMMTAYGSVDTAVEAMRRGAWHFVTKPPDGELLKGVHYFPGGASTQSLVMRSKSGTVRLINAHHRLDKLDRYSAVPFS